MDSGTEVGNSKPSDTCGYVSAGRGHRTSSSEEGCAPVTVKNRENHIQDAVPQEEPTQPVPTTNLFVQLRVQDGNLEEATTNSWDQVAARTCNSKYERLPSPPLTLFPFKMT
jgi:hypothetical protein